MQAVIIATDERVWIIGFLGSILAAIAIIEHMDGSLTTIAITKLNVHRWW